MFLLLLFILSCNECEDSLGTDIFIYIDFTELEENKNNIEIVFNNVDRILEIMEVDTSEHLCGFGEVRIFPIYDYNAIVPVNLSLSSEGSLENKYDRIDEIKEFKVNLITSLKKLIQTYKKESMDKSMDYKNSYIYIPICNGLTRLKKIKDKRKGTMIIFSDMLENSNLMSFYGNGLHKIKNNFNDVVKILNENCSLPDLSDISIQVIYTPNKEKDQLIEEAKRFWSKLFKLNNISTDPQFYNFDTYFELNR